MDVRDFLDLRFVLAAGLPYNKKLVFLERRQRLARHLLAKFKPPITIR